jgi:FKBP-type peptidyl-prolyl cis-trans isomerase (trigger factor)
MVIQTLRLAGERVMVNLSTLGFVSERTHPFFFTIRITVPAEMIGKLYKEVSASQQEHASVHGFIKGKTPLRYVTSAYQTSLLEHLKEFFYKHSVTSALYQALREQRMYTVGEPRLIKATIAPNDGAEFTFECTSPQELLLHDWRFYSFKPPKRKNYRDLDRQVEFFIKTEEENSEKYKDNGIQHNDWICFSIWVADKQSKTPLSEPQTLWLKIGNEEIDAAFTALFFGKRRGESFYSNAICLQEHFSSRLDSQYLFGITIVDVIPDTVFSLNDFKSTFRLRTNKEMHKKLIEVFSFRNDLSQRRETIEDVFKLFLTQHPVEIPKHIVLRRQEQLMHAMQENPDFQVYRVQRD